MTLLGINKQAMYHFTNTGGWKEINEGHSGLVYNPRQERYVDKTEADLTGLLPLNMVIDYRKLSGLPPEAYAPSSFGILAVQDWENNPEFPDALDILFGDIEIKKAGGEIILLKIDLTDSDDPYVFDRAHVERLRKISTAAEEDKPKDRSLADYVVDFIGFSFLTPKIKPASPQERWNGQVREAYQKYWESRVPLLEYDDSFSLAEVVVQKRIPIERIHWVREFPLPF